MSNPANPSLMGVLTSIRSLSLGWLAISLITKEPLGLGGLIGREPRETRLMCLLLPSHLLTATHNSGMSSFDDINHSSLL